MSQTKTKKDAPRLWLQTRDIQRHTPTDREELPRHRRIKRNDKIKIGEKEYYAKLQKEISPDRKIKPLP